MTDFSKIFVQDDKEDCVRFMGEHLTVWVPKRYETYDALTISETVKALGIFTMEADGVKCGLQIPAVVEMDPSETSEENIDGVGYIVCKFTHGDKLLTTLTLIQNGGTGYILWKEFIGLGNFPSYITYQNVPFLLDDLKRISGTGINVSHTILELAYAHIFRDAKDRTKYYRLTPMTQPPVIISIHDVAYGASSTHSRIFGSYANQGLNAALLNQNTKNSEMEDTFRQ